MRAALVLALALCAIGCRQPDGLPPTPTAEQSNEIGDIARDMINVVNKNPEAPEDLRGDLSRYSQTQDVASETDALARQLAQALAGARLDDETAQRLAHTLWLGLTAREFSESQIDALKSDLKTILTSAGVPEDRAQPVADRLGAVQTLITNNPRRWYQLF